MVVGFWPLSVDLSERLMNITWTLDHIWVAIFFNKPQFSRFALETQPKDISLSLVAAVRSSDLPI